MTTLSVLVILLITLGTALDLTLGAQVRRDLHDRLVAAATRADALAGAGTAPDLLVAQLGGGTVRALLISPDGSTHGDAAIDPNTTAGSRVALPPPPPPRPLDEGPAPPAPPPPPDGTATVVIHPLTNGSRVILVADTTQASQVRRDLRELMVAAGLIALAIAAALLQAVARRALSPLDRLTAIAGDITTGDRGRRLRPDRTDSDLGRAAAAFDGMLDALETAERRAHDAAHDASESAAQAHHAEAGTRRFLADAAHELRTPLAGIQAAAEQIAAHESSGDTSTSVQSLETAAHHRRVQLLLRDTRRASRLVRDMLDLSRIDAGVSLEAETTDLAQIADAEANRAAMLAPSITVVRTGAARAPVRADPTRLAQVLSNLLDNARRHTPPLGAITVEVNVQTDTVLLTVTDTGPGIPATDRERIFERLVRLDDARHHDHGGAGLGLPIAKALAEAHGGTLHCRLHQGGAQFQLQLPAHN